MEVIQTPIQGLIEIVPRSFPDERGWFMEVFKQTTFEQFGFPTVFPQDNLSFSKKGVIRGLHFQIPPYGQAKVVSVLQGKVLDVAVDLRKGSSTFGQYYATVLDADRHNMLLIPEGFAHGFSVIEDAYFFYKCSSLYNPKSESGIVWNDPDLNIDWKNDDPLISGKDQALPTLEELLRKSVISRDI